MEQLIYEVAGKKYVMVQVCATERNEAAINATARRLGAIQQAYALHKGGLFYKTYATVTLLIPEENVIEFNKSL